VSLPDLYTTAQLEIACGGADRLKQLAKAPSTSSSIYTDFLAAVRRAAESDVRSLVGVAYVLTDAVLNAAPFISECALVVAVYWAHWKGTGVQGIHDDLKASYTDAQKKLMDLRDGPRMPGTEDDAASAHGSQTVRLDDPTRILRGNMRGFC